MSNIKVFWKNIETDKKLEKRIIKKISSLEKFLKKDDPKLFFDVRVGQESSSSKKGNNFFAEAKITTSKKTYGAKTEDFSLLNCIDHLKEELSRKIEKNKTKRVFGVRKKAREAKNFIKKLIKN